MFLRPPEISPEMVTITFEGTSIDVPAGETVASALSIASVGATRTTPVSGAPRSAYCLMGVCFECLMVIDGKHDQQACMIIVREGMNIQRQLGASEVSSSEVSSSEVTSSEVPSSEGVT